MGCKNVLVEAHAPPIHGVVSSRASFFYVSRRTAQWALNATYCNFPMRDAQSNRFALVHRFHQFFEFCSPLGSA